MTDLEKLAAEIRRVRESVRYRERCNNAGAKTTAQIREALGRARTALLGSDASAVAAS